MKSQTFVSWDPSCSVHHNELDEQHRQIMATLNRLYCLRHEGVSDAMMRSILQDLLHYTERHCAHEEKLMAEWGYPGLPQQQEIHREMIAKTREIVQCPAEHYQTVFEQSILLLNQWWINHIRGLDHAYIPAMHAATETSSR